MAFLQNAASRAGTNRVPPAVARFASAIVARAEISDIVQRELIADAFMSVPRDSFLDARGKSRALEDSKLSTGFDQLTHAPYFLARMFALAAIQAESTVLELECGCGYASALMCVMGARVFATETVGLRAQATRRHLDELGLNRVLVATGYFSWVDSGPFDAIISHNPIESQREITNYLKLLDPSRGRLVAPVIIEGSDRLRLIQMGPTGPKVFLM